jgi:hypothetical protein
MFERIPSRASWILVLLCALAASAHAAYPAMNRHAAFAGTSYISVPNAAALNATLAQNGALTIDAWIRPTSYAGFPTIVGNTWNTGYWLGLNTNGALRFYPGSGTVTDGSAAVPLGVWSHVAVSFSDKDNEVRFYINGALDRVVSNVTVSLGTSSADLRIGADRQGASADYFFNGGIDEVRIWRTALNMATAVGSLYRIPQAWQGGVYGQSLLAAWRLNGNAVDSTGGFSGSVVGTVNWLAGPTTHYDRIAAVLPNTGNTNLDFFSIPAHPANEFTGSYTIELWTYLSSGGAATTFQTLVCKGLTTYNSLSYWFGVNKQNGRLRFAPNGVWANAVESSDPLPVGEWVHVAATWTYGGNSGTARVYINGVLRGSQSFNGPSPYIQSPLLVGSGDMMSLPGVAYALSGRVDELRLWNLARTGAEIAASYGLEFEGPAPGLTGVYHFDGDILDASVSANHGNNTNMMSQGLYFIDAGTLPPPVLSVTPALLTFAATFNGAQPPSQVLRISSTGPGTLTWTATPTMPWVSVTPASGGAGDSIVVSVDASGFAPGTYVGGVSLGGNASNVPVVVPVQLVVSTIALHPVAGIVTSNGTPLPNVEIRITGDSVLTLVTGTDGRFSVPGLRAGAYTVTAVSDLYAFAPVSHAIAALTGPRPDLNFSATPKTGSAMLRYRTGWNLISLPVDPADGRIATLLPDAVSGRAYRYAPDTGHVEVTSLVFGVGYWIKFGRTDSVRIDGQLRGDLRLRLRGAGGGWNLVGSGSGPVFVSDIRQFPSDALIIVYQYDAGIGYRLPPDNRLEPGRGYYMKVRTDADLSLTAPALRPPPDDDLPR